MNTKDLGTKPDTLTLSELVRLAAETLSPAAKMFIVATLEALRNNKRRSLSLMRLAEERCQDESERAYVLHGAAVLLFFLGDTEVALEKDKLSLDPCLRLGYHGLKSDVLSQLSYFLENSVIRTSRLPLQRRRRRSVPSPSTSIRERRMFNEQDEH